MDDKANKAEWMSLKEYTDLREEYSNNLETRVVLVGKTGVGKSKTGNTILGEQVFEAKLSASSVTKSCQSHVVKRDDKFIKVVDVPGFMDTKMTEQEERMAILQCVIEACPGIHAILFVIRIGRFTDEDERTLARFIEYFGEEAMQFVMVVFTGLDQLEDEVQTVKQFIANAPDDLVKFLKSIDNRYIAVNNKSKNNSDFVDSLLRDVRGMVDKNSGRFFTNEGLQDANDNVRKREEKMFLQINMKIDKEGAMDFISQHINSTKKQMISKLRRYLMGRLGVGLLGLGLGLALLVGARRGTGTGALVGAGGTVCAFVGKAIGEIIKKVLESDLS